jgi:hypothetical protein
MEKVFLYSKNNILAKWKGSEKILLTTHPGALILKHWDFEEYERIEQNKQNNEQITQT